MGYDPKNNMYIMEYSTSPNIIEEIVDPITINKEYRILNFIREKHVIIEQTVNNVRSAILKILQHINKSTFRDMSMELFVSLFVEFILTTSYKITATYFTT